MSLGTALYQTSYIVKRRDYTPDNLIEDVSSILKQADGRKFEDSELQIGNDKRPYITLTHSTRAMQQSILFPQDFLGQTAEFVGIIRKAAPTIANTVQEQLKPLDKLLWPR
jgi:hypothetical protein